MKPKQPEPESDDILINYLKRHYQSNELIDKLWFTLLEKQQSINRQLEESERKYNRRIEENNRIVEASEKKMFKQMEVKNLQVKEYSHGYNNEYKPEYTNDSEDGVKKEKDKKLANKHIQEDISNNLILIDVVTNLDKTDIERHINRMIILREQLDKNGDTRKIHGAIAGVKFSNAEKQSILDAGLIVLKQRGNAMKMDIPDDFIPAQW